MQRQGDRIELRLAGRSEKRAHPDPPAAFHLKSGATREAAMVQQESFDADGHGHFRDICVVYGDNHRNVFLQEFLEWFVRNAGKSELATLRKAVSARAATIGKGAKAGRPRAQDDPQWIVKAKTEAWRRFIDGWHWERIAAEEGLEPTKPNIRTIQRRVDAYAALIWRACYWVSIDGMNLEAHLATARVRQWLWVHVALFGLSCDPQWIAGCSRLVTTLYPRGERAASADLIRRARNLTDCKK